METTNHGARYRCAALLAIALLIAACGSTTSVEPVLVTLSEREIFPMSADEVSRLLAPIGGACRGSVLANGFAIRCTASSQGEAVAMLTSWLRRFEADLDPRTLTADEKRNGALLRGRVEGRVATIEFLHDPGLEGLMHE
jgi:hypothetical protein